MHSKARQLLLILCIFETILVLVLCRGLRKAEYAAFQLLFQEIPPYQPIKSIELSWYNSNFHKWYCL